jgi:enamine deaminase RidA (YjgF/YER057c/UK114 family)
MVPVVGEHEKSVRREKVEAKRTACRAQSTPREQAQSFYGCLPIILDKAGATMADVVLERVFFRDLNADFDVFSQARKHAYHRSDVGADRLPVASYVGQPPCTPGNAFELQVYALIPKTGQAANVTSIPATDGNPAAKLIEIGGCRHFYARDIKGQGGTFREQCDFMFTTAANVLARHGATFKNVLRTWCYSLARAASKITLRDMVELLEGVDLDRCGLSLEDDCPVKSRCSIQRKLKKLEEGYLKSLECVTIAELSKDIVVTPPRKTRD